MTTLTYSRLKEPATGWKAVLHMLGDFVDGIREGRRLEHRFDELARLSDSELAKRGIRREDLARVVLTGRYGL